MPATGVRARAAGARALVAVAAWGSILPMSTSLENDHPRSPSGRARSKPSSRLSRSGRAPSGSPTCCAPTDSTRTAEDQAATAAAGSAGAEVRIRWSKAPSAALAPSPVAMTICLNGTVVASPAA